jgi:exodeoxyribonuclease VII small subunit
MATKKDKKDTAKFEDSLKRLEGLVEKLESGNLTLAESLDSFETGMTLAKNCEDELGAASGRIEKIMKGFSGREKIVILNTDELDASTDGTDDF